MLKFNYYYNLCIYIYFFKQTKTKKNEFIWYPWYCYFKPSKNAGHQRTEAAKMASGKEKQHKKKRFPLQPKKVVNSKRKKEKVKKSRSSSSNNGESIENLKSKIKVKDTKLIDIVRFPTAAQQLEFFHEQYQSANRIQLSSLELDSFSGFFRLSSKKQVIHVLILCISYSMFDL